MIHHVVRQRASVRLECVIAADIVQWMQLHRYTANRLVSGPVRSMRPGQATPERANPAGFPDWCFTRSRGRSRGVSGPQERIIYIEVKRPGRKPTLIQRIQLERLRKDGFIAEWFDGFRAPEGKRPFLTWWKENA